MIEPTILIVDDEPEVLDLLVRTLEDHHFRCISASGLQQAKVAVETEDLELAICDLALGDGSGLDLLKYIRCARPSLPAIIVTGFPSISVAEEALRLGAFDLIEKPFDIAVLVEVVNEAVATRQQQVSSLREMLQVIERPAAFVDRRKLILATNSQWQSLVGRECSKLNRPIDECVAADSPLAFGDVLAGTCTADTVQAKLRLATEKGSVPVGVVIVPFRERREQPGGYMITLEADDETAAQGAGGNVALDSLTGCLSHRGFLEALDRVRIRALRRSLPVATMLIDIDDFRNLNQTHGYELGDRVLQDLADEIRRIVREDDLVGRYGGDEFAVALYEATADEAVGAANRLCAAVASLTYDVSGVSLPISLTIGVADCPAGYSIDNRRLVEQAQTAILWGRKNHRGPVVRYREDMNSAAGHPTVNHEEIERLTREFTEVNESLKAAYVESAQALVAAVEAKDPYTRKHSESVARYAEAIAREMNLPEPVQKSVCYAAVLHDVGKIGIPDSILTKPGPLDAEERELIAQHPMIGANIVSHVSCMRREVPFIQHHHENWDGSGYPAGLKGAAIPLGARILRVADSFDAMLAARSYKSSMEWDDAVQEIRSGSGSMYDPRVVAALEKAVRHGIPEPVWSKEEE